MTPFVKSLKITALAGASVLMSMPALADDPNQENTQTDELVVPLDRAEILPQTHMFSKPVEIEEQTKDVAAATRKPVIIRQDFEFRRDFKRAATYDIIGDNQAFISVEKTEDIDFRDYNDRAVTPEGRYQKPLVSRASVGVRRKF